VLGGGNEFTINLGIDFTEPANLRKPYRVHAVESNFARDAWFR